jgi:hypothetical protein
MEKRLLEARGASVLAVPKDVDALEPDPLILG